MSSPSDFLSGAIKQFEFYKMLGDKAMSQIPDEALFWQYNEQSNSIAIIVSHLSGNMISRWTDFLTTDGEKEWRDRDAEFEPIIQNKNELLAQWEKGWSCFLGALTALTDDDMDRIVYIRHVGHTVTEAISRQLAHYPYHIGQIVFISKMISGDQWQSLSIPRGNSKKYNENKFAKPNHRGHFTDEYLKDNK
jgi:hypothetical protein